MSLSVVDAARKLSPWVKKHMDLLGLVATTSSPQWQELELEEDIAKRLAKFKQLSPDGTVQTQAEIINQSGHIPESLKALNLHEGTPPSYPAIVTPASANQLPRLLSDMHRLGFQRPNQANPLESKGELPLSLAQINEVELVSHADGQLVIGAGISWTALREAAKRYKLAAPHCYDNVAKHPADAITMGILDAEIHQETQGVITHYLITLPLQNTRWLDRLWLFPDKQKAFDAFVKTARAGQVQFAQMISSDELQLAAHSGLIKLPKHRPFMKRPVGLRLVFNGPLFAALAAEFAASWALESKGAIQWNNITLPSEFDLCEVLLACGLTSVPALAASSFGQLANERNHLARALRESASEISPAARFTPMLCEKIAYAGGRLQLSNNVIVPRDYANPHQQWDYIFNAAASTEPLGQSKAEPSEETSITEESPEWQAIRHALLDETGQVRPSPNVKSSDDADKKRSHG